MTKPLFNWLKDRGAGVLLHPTSLPGSTGIGTLGAHAHAFVDTLEALGMRYWQLCPLGPTGYGDSPYQCFSAFAGNPYLIDLEELIRQGWLRYEELDVLRSLPQDRVDYGAQWQRRWPLLRLAWDRFSKDHSHPLREEVNAFREQHSAWLRPYASFAALKAYFNGRPWFEWPDTFRTWQAARGHPRNDELEELIASHEWYQFLFFRQWHALRAYANSKGVEIIGDIPIFVAMDSADVWSNPHLFQLGKDLTPTAVAGVPPDYFSPDGQLWGNPLFAWERHRKDGYSWWMERLGANFELYDVVRIDHFRGFDEYWAVPATAQSAKEGEWKPGPGLHFFEEVRKVFPDAKLIAEDLGLITESVTRLLEDTGLPGMAVLQFAFDGENSAYLPHNLRANNVLYPGTHDNNTCWGWYWEQPEKVRDLMRRYWRVSGDSVPWDFIRASYAAVSGICVIALQDFLSLGAEARMNTPGRAVGNWQWRCHASDLERLKRDSGAYLLELKELYAR